jgi:hypothetical protein
MRKAKIEAPSLPPEPPPFEERFQVRGEVTQYGDVVEAVKRAKKKGRGSEVFRVSDGAVLATISGHLPPRPREDE